MGERTDKIVDLKEDKKVKELRAQINELRAANTELRRQTRNKGLPVNVRDDLFAQIEENNDLIEELSSKMRTPTIVPVTETTTVAEHNYEADSNFRATSVRF